MKRIFVLLALAMAMVIPNSVGAAFTDITETTSHHENINLLFKQGVIDGYPDGTFRPLQVVTRGEAAKLLAKATESHFQLLNDEGGKNAIFFSDVNPSHLFFEEIGSLAQLHVINGYPDGTFKPEHSLTRGEMAKMIREIFKLDEVTTTTPFKDINSNYFKKDIEALFAVGIAKGKSGTTYAPHQLITRGELASFIVRAQEATALPGNKLVTEIMDFQLEWSADLKLGVYVVSAKEAEVFIEQQANKKVELDPTKKFVLIEEPLPSLCKNRIVQVNLDGNHLYIEKQNEAILGMEKGYGELMCASMMSGQLHVLAIDAKQSIEKVTINKKQVQLNQPRNDK